MPKVWGNYIEIKLIGKKSIYCPSPSAPLPLLNYKVSSVIYFSHDYIGSVFSGAEFAKYCMDLKYRANQVMSLNWPH